MISLDIKEHTNNLEWHDAFAWLPKWIWNINQKIVGNLWLERFQWRHSAVDSDIIFHRPIRKIKGYTPIE